MSPPRQRLRHTTQRGAALLLAMLILTLVSTLAAGMLWQQWRAVEVEAAERARTQAAWILTGARDWARLMLREDALTPGPDHLGEPWAVPLAEARLSTFLASDRNNNMPDDGGIDAFLSGRIEDAQARYNLRNLIDNGRILPKELLILERLCSLAGLAPGRATTIATGLRDAWQPAQAGSNAPVPPTRVSELVWLGMTAEDVEKLSAWVVLLPMRTPVNINTAPREVLAAVIEGLDLGTAQRLVEARQRTPFKSPADVLPLIPGVDARALDSRAVTNKSIYFVVRGRLRLGERVLEEVSLVQRRNLDVLTLQRERQN
jgi:general secretion pathway protein K